MAPTNSLDKTACNAMSKSRYIKLAAQPHLVSDDGARDGRWFSFVANYQAVLLLAAGQSSISDRPLTLLRFMVAVLMLVAGAATAAAADPLANGIFLVAKPDLRDPNFRETVVLITEPEVGGGPLGVIVNRPLGRRLSELIPDAGHVPEQFDAVFFGGPVARTVLLFLVRGTERPAHSLHVLDDVYLSSDGELLDRVMRGESTPLAFRAYAGYSGWAPGQLEIEIARGGWYVTKADATTIFSADPAAVWKELVHRLSAQRTRLSESTSVLPAMRERDAYVTLSRD